MPQFPNKTQMTNYSKKIKFSNVLKEWHKKLTPPTLFPTQKSKRSVLYAENAQELNNSITRGPEGRYIEQRWAKNGW